jgi:hypothetical protein
VVRPGRSSRRSGSVIDAPPRSHRRGAPARRCDHPTAVVPAARRRRCAHRAGRSRSAATGAPAHRRARTLFYLLPYLYFVRKWASGRAQAASRGSG